MKVISVELYTDQKNNAVLKLPGREYPGVLIQGDTLRCFIDDLRETLEECSEVSGSEDIMEGIRDVLERLESLQQRYNSALSND